MLEAVHPETEVVGIDEGQFFDSELPMVCNSLADAGKRVIVAGLDQDYLGRPFEPMPQLLAIAEYITKTLAICVVCGSPANHTQRIVAGSDRVMLGAHGTVRGEVPPLLRPALLGHAKFGVRISEFGSIEFSRAQAPAFRFRIPNSELCSSGPRAIFPAEPRGPVCAFG